MAQDTTLLTIYYLSPLAAAATNLTLAIWVINRNPKARANQLFSLMSGSLVIWNFGCLMTWTAANPQSAMLWSKILHLGLVFIPALFFHFTLTITKQRAGLLWMLSWIGYALAIFFLFCDATGVFLSGVRVLPWGYTPVSGPISEWFDKTFAFYSLSVFSVLFYSYRKAKRVTERNRFMYLLIALLVAALGAIPNFLMVRGIEIYPIGHGMNVAYTSIVAYTILRYRLMDINVVLKRTAMYSSVVALALGGYAGVIFLLVRTLQQFGVISSALGIVMATVFLALFLQPIFRYTYSYINRHFFREEYEVQDVLQELSRSVVTFINLEDLAAHTLSRLHEVFRVKNAAIFLRREESDHYILHSSLGFETTPDSLPKDNALVSVMSEAREPLVSDEIERMVEVRISSLRKRRRFFQARSCLEALEAKVCVPLRTKDFLLGFLTIGDRVTGRIFSPQDVSLLSTLGNHLSVAMQNAILYQQLEETYQRLGETQATLLQAEKLASVGELAAGVAHEINNPLGTALLAAQGLAKQLGTESPGNRYLKLVEENIFRCKNIIASLLDFSRPKEPSVAPTVVAQVLENAIALASSHKAMKTIHVTSNVDSHLPPIEADPDQLLQVFLNLILNAALAMPEGGDLRIHSYLDDNYLKIEFRDNGCGIPEENIEKIFDPFFTTRRSEGGTGLGLSVSQSIIRKHGGNIEVESKEGQGSTFTVVLPLQESK